MFIRLVHLMVIGFIILSLFRFTVSIFYSSVCSPVFCCYLCWSNYSVTEIFASWFYPSYSILSYSFLGIWYDYYFYLVTSSFTRLLRLLPFSFALSCMSRDSENFVFEAHFYTIVVARPFVLLVGIVFFVLGFGAVNQK